MTNLELSFETDFALRPKDCSLRTKIKNKSEEASSDKRRYILIYSKMFELLAVSLKGNYPGEN